MTDQQPSDGASDTRSQIRSGVTWKAVSTISVQGTRAVVAVILARLLTPYEFGLASAVLIFSGLALVLTDLALGSALIQQRRINEADRSTVFWTSAAAGLLLTVVAAALSGVVASFYGAAEIAPLFAAFSVTFLLSGISTTQASLLQRELRFRSLETRMIIATLVGGVVGVSLAFLGFGAWAVVLQAITASIVSTVLLWLYSSWRPSLVFSIGSLRRLGGNAAKLFGAQFLYFVSRNTDALLIGRFLGPSALGIYSIAFNLMLFPVTRIAGPIRAVLFPAFSRVQDDAERMRTGWERGNQLVGAAAMPVMLGIVAVAPDFVPVVLGDQWGGAIRVVQILAIVGLVQSLQTVGTSTLTAAGHMGTLFAFTLASYAASVLAFFVGVSGGINGVAVAFAVASVALFPVFVFLSGRAVGGSLLDFVRSMAGITASAIAMLVAVVLLRVGLEELGVGQALRLALCIAAGALIYLPMLAVTAPAILGELRRFRRRRSGPGVSPPSTPGEA